MANSALTKKQREVFDTIVEYISDHNMPPTRKELSELLGFKSPNAAEVHIKALVKKGVISSKAGASRGITPIHKDFGANVNDGVPLLGKVAAGIPLNAIGNESARINIDPNFFRPRADFFLTVEGESMKDIGLFNGDYVAVKHAKNACNGQVVVARLSNGITIKRMFQEGSIVKLISENLAFESIVIDTLSDEFEIEGVMVGSIRRYSH